MRSACEHVIHSDLHRLCSIGIWSRRCHLDALGPLVSAYAVTFVPRKRSPTAELYPHQRTPRIARVKAIGVDDGSDTRELHGSISPR